MRAKIVAANWKMVPVLRQGQLIAYHLLQAYQQESEQKSEVIICPPYTHLLAVSHLVQDFPKIHVGAQNMHQEEQGAFTGEISADMLVSVGMKYVILGHSERRAYFSEDNGLLARKLKLAISKELKPIFCIGETLEQREAGETENTVGSQLKEGAFALSKEEFAEVILAYEPVWAIGTGKTATPQQAQDVHAYIRSLIAEQYGQESADATSILYGGSVKPANATELFTQPDIDGGLVGGASLEARSFMDIILASENS